MAGALELCSKDAWSWVMCDANLVREMIDKHKPEPLKCLVSTKCWCNKLKKRLSHDFIGEQCLSPSELLLCHSACFCAEDIAYLKSLASREFVSIDT